jgi:diguanylate cyclase (GGDEF)-like protein/PAS domain S-box-containing protein
MGRQHYTRPFMLLVIIIGAAASLFSAYLLPYSQITIRFLLLAVATIGIGSRITIQIPRVRGYISMSDTFVFLALLLFDGEAAILLAALEALCSSARFSRKPVTLLFNSAVMGLSTFLTVWVLRFSFGPIENLLKDGYSRTLIVALCVMALVQYVLNTSMVAIGGAFKTDQPIWQTWKNNYLWTSLTYFAGVSAAGIISKLSGALGFYACIAATPIIAIVYFTYLTYLKNIEASMAQTEQAERHVLALRESEERFRSAFDYAAIGMALVSPDGRWLQVNHSLCEIVGYTEQELLETSFQAITHPDDLAGVLANINQLLEGRLPACQTEKRYFHKHGHEVWALLSVSLSRDSKLESLRFIFQIQDITDRKRAEQQLLHDAFHDALTGLPNRSLFMDHLKLAVGRSKRRSDCEFAVLFLDLDRFKIVNDSLGHMVGDQLLIGIARRLETCLRPGDSVARLGGDEFTILLGDIRDAAEAISVAERIKQELMVPFNIGGHEVFTTVSIGIAPSMTGYDRAEDMLRDADTAMYRAKSLGKTRHEVFDKAMHARAMTLLQIETDLRRAVDRKEFILNYQPIVSLETGTIKGFEALIRWQHPEQGFISPAEFIPVAEETGMIVPIGHWVLAEACQQMKQWHEMFPTCPLLHISVNLSGRQFTQPDLIEQIKQVLSETGLDPRSLKLEITESTVMENIDTAIDMLKQLRAIGVELSIDDFGTGYSSLSYLHRFPISTLKIDRSFVGRMSDNNENTEIVRTILMLARNLGMDVVAEGVETEEQLAQLRSLGCECGQGYLFSKPTSAELAAKAIAENLSHEVAAKFVESFAPLRQTLAA